MQVQKFGGGINHTCSTYLLYAHLMGISNFLAPLLLLPPLIPLMMERFEQQEVGMTVEP